MKTVLQFTNTGKAHNDETGFFKFLVEQKLSLSGSRVIQWCRFEGLKVIIEALEPEVIKWAESTIGQTVETETGYKFSLV